MPARDAFMPTQLSDLKLSNRNQILSIFLDGNPHSINDISDAVGVSRQTVMKSVQFFLKGELLTLVGKGEAGKAGGKRPLLYTLSHKKYLICVTLWPKALRLYLYNIPGDEIDRITLDIPLPTSGKTAMDNVGHLIETILLKNGVSKSDLCSVSISTSGTIDRHTNCLKYSSQSPEWGVNVPLEDYLRPYLADKTTIFLENACKMAARPYLLNASYKDQRLLVLFSTWGLSGCLIENGHILNGGNSLIGEIGHMVIHPSDPEVCGCGSRGCLERLVSIKRLRGLITQELENSPHSVFSSKDLSALTMADIFTASAEGDPLARKCVDYLAETFSIALHNVSLIFDPDIIIFQGDFSSADDYFTQRLYKYLHAFQYYPQGGPFAVLYDRSDLYQMDSIGSLMALRNNYFSDTALYTDEGE